MKSFQSAKIAIIVDINPYGVNVKNVKAATVEYIRNTAAQKISLIVIILSIAYVS